MAFLPLIALGGVGYLHATGQATQKKQLPTPTNEDRMNDQNLATLKENGGLAAVWQTNLNTHVRMGAPISDVQGLNVSGGGCPADPSVDPTDALYRQFIGLTSFDRQHKMYALGTKQGTVREGKRVPICTALTQEVHHPNDPEKRSFFMQWSYTPNFPNRAQIRQAQKLARSDADPSASQRDQYGVQFFTRAPGQSFRYE